MMRQMLGARLGSRLIAGLVVALAVVVGGGCSWVAHGIAGGERTVKVEADYRGLDNRSVAVMVWADEYTLFAYPRAPQVVARTVSGAIAEHVPGVTMMNPQQIVAWQQDNPYWVTRRYSELIEALDVERLVLVDLVEYRTHEPGNAHVWQGVVTGNVMVIEAESEDPDNPAYFSTVRVQFPEDSTLGVVHSDARTIQLGMLTLFARKTAGLFHDHEVTE